MRDAIITSIILHHLMKNLPTSDNYKSALKQHFSQENSKISCNAFLCSGECFDSTKITSTEIGKFFFFFY